MPKRSTSRAPRCLIVSSERPAAPSTRSKTV
uniref:Uncharacterized protein n=1 Tax=Arundo donax TaxID=35708 RepID=A0A0A9DUP2_ARUDO